MHGFVFGNVSKYDYKHGKPHQWPNIRFGAWRLHDIGVNWTDIEPNKGEWKWERLDTFLDLAQEHGVDLLYPFELTPKWASARPDEKSAYGPGNAAEPKDIEDWRKYVRAMVNHCKGKVRYYEGWNEPNNNTIPAFFTGTKDKLIELQREIYEIVKSIDPDAIVVSPSIVGDRLYLDYLLEHGMGRYCDILGYHFYAQPEKMQQAISDVQSLMAARNIDKPLWNTEAGWPIRTSNRRNVIAAENMYAVTPNTAGDYIARAYILNWAMAVKRYYWYAWDNGMFGIIERDGEATVAVKAYTSIYQWLVGSIMTSCGMDEDGNWIAVLNRPDIGAFRIVWRENGTAGLSTGSWKATRVDDLYGNTKELRNRETIEVTPSPQRVYH